MIRIVEFADGTFGVRKFDLMFMETSFLTMDYYPTWQQMPLRSSEVPTTCKTFSAEKAQEYLDQYKKRDASLNSAKDRGKPLKTQSLISQIYSIIMLLKGPKK